ncbi:MAG: hypothetical protein P4L33_19425 [Capsulimonadaceae bacterium]|nr:hypothetical protein [Capsulimonadaceae bacterium]
MQTQMSGYSKLNASPFWMGVFRITGILCLVTLMLPSAYFAKYALIDAPAQARVARAGAPGAFDRPVNPRYVQYLVDRTRPNNSCAQRIRAIAALGDMVSARSTLITHPIECLRAKLCLENLARTDHEATVRAAASASLHRAALHGVVVGR